MRPIVWLLLIPVAGLLAVAAAVAGGLIDFSAARPPGRLEETLARFALDRSIARRAPVEANPLAGSDDAARSGLRLFRVHCASCHGAPGVDPSEGGASLNPPAPGLTLPRVQARSEGELRWIVANGIRMTGMPAFGPSRSEAEIWQLVAALRRLPKMSSEERRIVSGADGR